VLWVITSRPMAVEGAGVVNPKEPC